MTLRATFWDVQHGSACWLGMPNGEHIVIDLGSGQIHGSDAAYSPLAHMQRAYGVRQLAALLITHPHKDHINDIVMANLLSPRVLHRPGLTAAEIRQGNPRDKDSAALAGYIELDRRYNAPVAAGANPISASRADGASIRCFLPTRCPASNLNNRSIVTVVEYAGVKLLIPGDNEKPSWDELLGRSDFVEAIRGTHVLVAAHHGREAGFCAQLFDVISPLITVISDGPAPTSATARYKAVTQGWTTFYRRGGSERRFCLTTRHDNDIVIECGFNHDGGNFLSATVGAY